MVQTCNIPHGLTCEEIGVFGLRGIVYTCSRLMELMRQGTCAADIVEKGASRLGRRDAGTTQDHSRVADWLLATSYICGVLHVAPK